MANGFSKEERVAFEDILAGFNDALVMSRNVSVYQTDQTMMERTNNIIWRPMPYIMVSYTGTDMTSNFKDRTQLSVPSTIGFNKSVPWAMTATELRDALQEGRLADGAKQKLASDINVAIMNVASAQGSLVVPVSAAPGKYDHIALADTLMNETGVPMMDRYFALSSRDYNGLAADISGISRSFGNPKSDQAYERSYVGPVAGFETYKMDYANRIAAAGGGSRTINTEDAGLNYYNPVATSTAATGEVSNVDNRFQTVTVSSSSGVVAGDCFTIADVYNVHAITKVNTGQLKTFRVISVPAGGTTLVITPPIISNQVANDAAAQYQNCSVTAKSATATITWLNIDPTQINCFWHRDALEILPGRYAVPNDAGAAVMRGTTDQGLELVMTKQYDIKTMKTFYRLDTLFGVVNKNPEMSGILLFNQIA